MYKEILYCVLHTRHQKERVGWIKSTWGLDKDIIFYSDYNDLQQNVFKVSDRDDYGSGQEKQINVFSFLGFILNTYEWYFFCDNDTFVNTKLLESKLFSLDIDKVYGSIINYYPDDNTLYYPSGGAGFLIHNSVIKKIIPGLTHNSVIYSDVSIGMNLRNQKITLVNNDLFHSQNPTYYGIEEKDIRNHISFHYIKTPELMDKLNILCQ